MSKKSILILKIILIVSIIILLIAILWFFYNKKDKPIINNNATVNERNDGFLNRNNSANNNINQQNGTVNSTAKFTSIAKLAAERFGSYSSDTHNFANLRDMQYLMTDKMKQWADNFINNLSAVGSSGDEYYGVTTKALSIKIVSYNEKQDAEVVVSCQKIETKIRNKPQSKTKYQGVRIKMLYENEKWLIDELQWE